MGAVARVLPGLAPPGHPAPVAAPGRARLLPARFAGVDAGPERRRARAPLASDRSGVRALARPLGSCTGTVRLSRWTNRVRERRAPARDPPRRPAAGPRSA